ncbi:4901_t:CDS:10 [Racocetra fulgida]|uniref:4901_t:CDS:1 n=1 Tax=Racocetra fulgida TaxID=60492 RepID=A0A9N8WDM5_9GLOM|nr:4901_t:CDS:10 [Racocetra fulgida]
MRDGTPYPFKTKKGVCKSIVQYCEKKPAVRNNEEQNLVGYILFDCDKFSAVLNPNHKPTGKKEKVEMCEKCYQGAKKTKCPICKDRKHKKVIQTGVKYPFKKLCDDCKEKLGDDENDEDYETEENETVTQSNSFIQITRNGKTITIVNGKRPMEVFNEEQERLIKNYLLAFYEELLEEVNKRIEEGKIKWTFYQKTDIEKVYDPACGVGALLYTFRKYKPDCEIYGQEIEHESVLLARGGQPEPTNGQITERSGIPREQRKGKIKYGNTLESDGFKRQFHIVLCNPPFNQLFKEEIHGTKDGNIALVKHNYLEAVFFDFIHKDSSTGNAFDNAQLDTCVLLLRKNREDKENIYFINCAGKTKEQIIAEYKSENKEKVSRKRLKEHDYCFIKYILERLDEPKGEAIGQYFRKISSRNLKETDKTSPAIKLATKLFEKNREPIAQLVKEMENTSGGKKLNEEEITENKKRMRMLINYLEQNEPTMRKFYYGSVIKELRIKEFLEWKTATTSVPAAKLEKTNRHLKKENGELKEKLTNLTQQWQETKTKLASALNSIHDLQNEREQDIKARFATAQKELEEENAQLQAQIEELAKRPTADEVAQQQEKASGYNNLKNEVETLQNKLIDLEPELDETKQNLTSANGQVNTYEGLLNKREQEIIDLKKQLADLTNANQENLDKTNDLLNQQTDQQRLLTNEQKKTQSLQAKCKSLRVDRDQQARANELLVKNVVELTKNHKKLLTELQQEKSAHEATQTQLTNELDDTEKYLDELRQKYQSLAEKLNSLDKKLTSGSYRKPHEEEEEIEPEGEIFIPSDLNKQLETILNDYQQIKQEAKWLEIQLQEQKEVNQQLIADLNQAEVDRDSNLAKITELEEQKQQLEEQEAEKEQELNELQAEKKQLETELQSATTVKNNTLQSLRDLQEENQTLQEELATTEQQRANTEAAYDVGVDQLAQTQEKLDDKTTDLNNTLRSLNELQTENQALLAQLQTQDNLTQQLGQDFAAIRNSYQNLDQQKDNIIQSLHDLQGENQQLENSIDDRLAERDALATEKNREAQKVNLLQKKSLSLRTNLNQTQTNLTDSQNQVQRLTNDNNNLQEQLTIKSRNINLLANKTRQLRMRIQQTTQQLTTANNTITTAQTQLGIADLTNLPNLAGKSLTELIDYFQHHRCSGCHLSVHADYDTIKQERDKYKSELDSHVCPSCSEICCVNGDYQQIKQELSQQENKCQKHLAEKEAQIITQIITECQLGLSSDSALAAVINRLKELINKGPDSSQDTLIADLQQQLRDKDKPSEDIKQQLKELSQELGLSDQVVQSLQTASSYSELVSRQKQAFSAKLGQEIKSKEVAQR